jgi:hypothetical protein
MSVEITIDGTNDVRAVIDKIKLQSMGLGSKIANDIADWVVIVTKNNIVERDLYVTGELYDSVGKVDNGNFVEVFVGGPSGGGGGESPAGGYAGFLERGTDPSPGRYVPDIDKRLVNTTREGLGWGSKGYVTYEWDIGVHPGNQGYWFFRDAVEEVNAYTDDDWFRSKVDEGLE